jgi:hypothetical protein
MLLFVANRVARASGSWLSVVSPETAEAWVGLLQGNMICSFFRDKRRNGGWGSRRYREEGVRHMLPLAGGLGGFINYQRNPYRLRVRMPGVGAAYLEKRGDGVASIALSTLFLDPPPRRYSTQDTLERPLCLAAPGNASVGARS